MEIIDSEDTMQGDGCPIPGPNDQAMELAESVTMGELSNTTTPIVAPPADAQVEIEKTYEEKKAEIERKCCRIDDPFEFVVIKEDEDGNPCKDGIQRFTHLSIQHYLNNEHFHGLDKDNKWTKQKFAPKWLADEQIRCYKRLVSDPTNTDKDVLNLWRGFKAEKIPPVDPSAVAELIQPIRRHIIEVLTDGNEEHGEWLLDYLASIVQRPAQRTQVGVCFYGTEGSGKGMIFEALRTGMFGDHCTFQSSNAEQDLFGRFANMGINCVLAQMDEVQDLYKFWDRLKNVITSDTINIEMKNKQPITVKSMLNLIFTTNNENALKVSPNDRRFVLFRCSSLRVNDYRYNQEFGSHLKRPHVMRAFYQHLLERDLSAYPYDFQNSRPITSYFKEAQMSSICPIDRFISSRVNDNKCNDTRAKDLFDDYKTFVTNGGYRVYKTMSSFCTDVKRIHGVTVRRANTGMVYKFDAVIVKKYLQEKNHFDPDATSL